MDTSKHITIKKKAPCCWEIPLGTITGMNVPGIIYASEDLLPSIQEDQAPLQVANVACLPGILKASYAMPDIHWGYGFPIGGVAATDWKTGVVSPGGVGYDISCGVRLLSTQLNFEDIKPRLKELVSVLFQHIPCGVGSTSHHKLSMNDLNKVLNRGVNWVVEQGWGNRDDIAFHEEHGCLRYADDKEVSPHAKERGHDQLGTLGSGNHFLEIQVVDEVYDPQSAAVMGLFKGQVAVMIHSGSRGLGYQVCDDFLDVMRRAMHKYGIQLPDMQLACAPVQSEEGQRYLRAMAAAANFGMANRQYIMHLTREVFYKVLSISPKTLGMNLIYDVCHNIAKKEEHLIDGEKRQVCVHRKGATRAFPAGHPLTPEQYKSIGQPVLVPGDMGRYSFVLTGTQEAMELSFGSTCHGAGRMMSRSRALKETKGRLIDKELEARGIYVQSRGRKTLHEEVSEAYKDVSKVVEACQGAGLSRKIARLRPVGVIKG
jgi:tRNA-splicing ligase RtcB